MVIVSNYSSLTFLPELGLDEVLGRFAFSETYYERLTESFGNSYDPAKAETPRVNGGREILALYPASRWWTTRLSGTRSALTR